jgi:hypothetical protein
LGRFMKEFQSCVSLIDLFVDIPRHRRTNSDCLGFHGRSKTRPRVFGKHFRHPFPRRSAPVSAPVPPGTTENSPAIHRWVTKPHTPTSPVRDGRTAECRPRLPNASAVPDGTRAARPCVPPALKRWAILFRPAGLGTAWG